MASPINGVNTLSIAIAIVYYIFLLAAEPLGKQGRVHPFWAMWSADIFFAALTALLYRHVLRDAQLLPPRFSRRGAEPAAGEARRP